MSTELIDQLTDTTRSDRTSTTLTLHHVRTTIRRPDRRGHWRWWWLGQGILFVLWLERRQRRRQRSRWFSQGRGYLDTGALFVTHYNHYNQTKQLTDSCRPPMSSSKKSARPAERPSQTTTAWRTERPLSTQPSRTLAASIF